MAGAGRRLKGLDLRVPFFRPMWRRVATSLVVGMWFLLEFVFGNLWWAVLAGGIWIYSAYVFFFAFEAGDVGEK